MFEGGKKASAIFWALLPVLLAQCAGALERNFPSHAEALPVTFHYSSTQAESVCLSATFNQWSPDSHCLNQAGGTWSITVELPPGQYRYVYVIDGARRVQDPQNPFVEEDGFGIRNSILIVE